MNFETWLKANDYKEDTLTDAQRKHLLAAYTAETAPPPAPELEKKGETVKDQVAIFEAEAERKEFITQTCAQWAKENTLAGTEKFKQLRILQDAAYADEKMDKNAFNLQMLRFDRMVGQMVLTPKAQQTTDEVVEAAVCMAGGISDVEKHFNPQTLEAAHKQFRGGLGLHGMIGYCARGNGWNGSDVKSNWYQAIRYGFQNNGMQGAVTGPSTYSLPNMFSSIANKFLTEGFNAVDSSWREIAQITRFSDLKAKTEVGLTGSMLYSKLPPSGEIKHTTIGEIVYTNTPYTYAVMLGLDRSSLINDDVGALTAASRKMGRGYGTTLASLVWTVFLNNTSFFSSGNSNVITGGTSVLSGATGLEALRLADEKFRLQTDPDGLPVGSEPKILLVPSALRISAMNLMNSTQVVGSTTANSLMPDGNAFSGAYKVVSSPYLQNSAYTGYSTTAWYILADPSDIPVLEVGFLNGQDSPTVETENAEFNMLGVALRGYFDAGIALKEYRGGVRAAGT